jgi:hypothetical protein
VTTKREYRTSRGEIVSHGSVEPIPSTDRAERMWQGYLRWKERRDATQRQGATQARLAAMMARLEEELPKAIERLRAQRRQDELDRLFAEVDKLTSQGAIAERALHDSSRLREYMGLDQE